MRLRLIGLVFALLPLRACEDDDGSAVREDPSEEEVRSDDEDQSKDESAEVEEPFARARSSATRHGVV